MSVAPLRAQTQLGSRVTVGGGLRTSFVHLQPDAGTSTDKFQLDSVRLYVNGTVTEQIKLMLNTEYDGFTNKIGVLDAVARIEASPRFNIWMGRFLPPSDRANLHGPYYAHHWGVYTDGIQDGYPFVFQGRDNGIVYWGDFDRVKVSVGAFDGASATGNSKLLGAARVQLNFWDRESGYYLNGTYYGSKKLLSIGGAMQVQGGRTAYTVDFLLERKLPNGGVVSVESEYANYNGLGGYDGGYAKSQGQSALASYLFPQKIGVGQIELLGKVARAQFTRGLTPNYHQKTNEVNLNYVIKEFNARVMLFFRDTRFNAVRPDSWQAGLGLQIQI
ncbi:MAG TPA: hypothetical protein VJ302_16900 [Blastocatellia bacterium]|nr:hypothetical protein [Blastocatellia bacterium]